MAVSYYLQVTLHHVAVWTLAFIHTPFPCGGRKDLFAKDTRDQVSFFGNILFLNTSKVCSVVCRVVEPFFPRTGSFAFASGRYVVVGEGEDNPGPGWRFP